MSLTKGIYIFVGPPGAGKGSISQQCVSDLGLKQLSTGNLCRWHIVNETDIGREIDLAIKSGKLVSDRLVSCMVDGWLSKEVYGAHMGAILDGYPRTVAQVRDLDGLLKKRPQLGIPRVVKFLIPDELVVARLSARHVCSNLQCQRVYSLIPGSEFAPAKENECDECAARLVRRADDQQGVVQERLRVYHQHEKDLLAACRQVGWDIFDVDVNRSSRAVCKSLEKIVDSSG